MTATLSDEDKEAIRRGVEAYMQMTPEQIAKMRRDYDESCPPFPTTENYKG